VSATEPTLEDLLRASSSDTGIDRRAIAALLLEAARSIDGPRVAAASSASGFGPSDPRVDELRRLLVGGEIDQLGRLTRRVEDPEAFAEAVGGVLASAFAQASSRDARLGQVMAPALERATQVSIRSDPRTLVNILYPLILPAIRKSIAETIDGTFQSLNESLKHSLSWRGLAWRLEAWRTGKPFAEVVLRHTLLFQVEHVFLIHRHTGLLIAHVTAEQAASQDPQLVSSMLVAIQDFVRDSFSGAESGGLDTLRLGELLLWSEQGTYATLVAVIRGNPPEGLHDTLREALATIHTERHQALEAFDGDSAAFADIDAQLAGIVALRQEASPRRERAFPWMLGGAAVLVLLLGAWLAWHWWDDRSTWQAYVARLQAEPGIAVTGTDRRDGRWVVTGLRDPLAADPQALLREAGIDPERVSSNWQPYQALNPILVLKRLQGSLDTPPTVALAVEGDTIVATGSASSSWLQRARNVGRAMPLGSPAIDLTRVRDLNDGEVGRLRAKIQSYSIRFDYNEAIPAKDQDALFDEIATRLRELVDLSSRLRVNSRVTVTGHSDTTGKGLFNLSLSTARAEVVRAFLKKRGVDPDLLAVRGAGPLEPLKEEATDVERSLNRRVSFTVSIDE
jgi:outer membrane protein OmpA-like peptidoglycan-associated protein